MKTKKYISTKEDKDIYELWESKDSQYKYITRIDGKTKQPFITFEYKSEKERQRAINYCLNKGSIIEFKGV